MGRGRYALPALDEAVATAHGINGTLSLTSAALAHGWEVKSVPDRPHVIVPRKRKVSAVRRAKVQLHRGDLAPEDVLGVATSHETTLLQCLRALPFDEALAVADSALRNGVDPLVLQRVQALARGPGAARVRRVVREATPRAANPFESVLRAIALGVPGLAVEPQVLVRGAQWVRPDLVDRQLGIALEADSFAWHGSRGALRRDTQRYNGLVVAGWLVLRFAWEDVMLHPDDVRRTLEALVALAEARTQPRGGPHFAA